MARLNRSWNHHLAWHNMLTAVHRRVAVDLEEVDRVIEIARRTPDLAGYASELRRLAIYFDRANHYFRNNAPERLVELVDFWERYRDVVTQRFTGVTPAELRAADKIAKDVFDNFLNRIPNVSIAYARDATPLVYGGKGGIDAYFTHPPELNRPFAIISLPHTAFDNVWQWLALPHEAGHDTYKTVSRLSDDLEDEMDMRMRNAVRNGELDIPPLQLDLRPYGLSYGNVYTAEDLIAKIWRTWTNEAQADLVGLLNCGGAAILALQQIVGFDTEDAWYVAGGHGRWSDGPEVHPTPYVRNALNIAALRIMDGAHAELADEIEARVLSLARPKTHITWWLGRTVPVVRIAAEQMVRSATLAAEVIMTHPLEVLGGKSYAQLCSFNENDQALVDTMTNLLLDGEPEFAQVRGGRPCHALAATMFAFEHDRSKAHQINHLFKHFV